MDRYLKKPYNNLGIKLGRIKNKIYVLSTISKENIPILRAHKLYTFKPINLKSQRITVVNFPQNRYVNKNIHFLMELEILSISKKDFIGKEKKIDSNSTITPSSNDLIELSIIIKPPVHKERR